MTKSRTAFRAFQEQLAREHNRPLWAATKGLFWAFIAFNLLMGFLLGTVPLARNAYFHFIYHIQIPVLTWFDEMGWEGQVTAFALMAALTLAVIYISRNYLALIVRAVWMKLVDLKNWFDRDVRKKTGSPKNVAPLAPRRAVATTPPTSNTQPPTSTPPPAPKYTSPTERDTSKDTAIVGG